MPWMRAVPVLPLAWALAAAAPAQEAAPQAAGGDAPAGSTVPATDAVSDRVGIEDIGGATVPMGEITGRSKLIADRVRSLERRLEENPVERRLEPELVELAGEIEPRIPLVGTQLAATPSLTTLDGMHTEWEALRDRISSREERLRRRVSELEQEMAQLEDVRDLWARTVTRARARGAPPGIVEAAEAAFFEIERVIESAQGTLNEVLILQSQFAELNWTTRDTLDLIESTRKRIVANILVRDEVAIWADEPFRTAEPAAGGSLYGWTGQVLSSARDYARKHPDRVVLHVVFFLLLAWLIRRTHRSIGPGAAAAGGDAGPTAASEAETAAGRAEDSPPQPAGAGEPDGVVAAALLATRHPVAAAAILALLATFLFHPAASHDLSEALRLLIVVPLLFVLRPLLGAQLRGPLYLLTGFFVTDRIREVLTDAPYTARIVFLCEMAVGVILLLWVLRSTRLEKLPASARHNRWLSAVGIWARIAAGAMLFSLVAGAAGYMRVALLLGNAVLGSAYLALAFYAVARIAESVAAAAFRGGTLGHVRMVLRHREFFVRRSRGLVRLGAVVAWVYAVTGMLALREPVADMVATALSTEMGYGSFKFTLGGFAAFVVTILAAWLVSRTLHFVLDEEVYPRVSLPRGVPFALSTLTRYTILLIGFLVAVSALGFDLDRITILLGAFGVGIGFGLQNVVNNFVSGLILLFERPVKVGDRVELQDLEGQVRRIGIRASTVRTWDGADVIVPNASLISDRVVNWTFADRLRRVIVPVGVAYGTDPHRVIDLLKREVDAHPEVCPDPEPVVLFMGFGESSLDFEVRFFTDKSDAFFGVRSQVALAAHDALQREGIQIPFPQRDLHLRSVDAAMRGRADEPARPTPVPDPEPRSAEAPVAEPDSREVPAAEARSREKR